MMWVLMDFDSKSLCMEKILYIFRNLKKHILSLKGEPLRQDIDLADAMKDVFYCQWRMVKTYLYHVGALLSP